MNFWLYVKQAFSSLMANKLRAILSILGIVIGISSVVIMLGVGEGVKASIIESFDNAENMLTIQKNYLSFSPDEGARPKEQATNDVMKLETLDDLKKNMSNIEYVVTETHVSADIKFNGNIYYNDLKAVSQDYSQAKGIKIKLGTDFTSLDFDNKRRVVVLGHATVKNIFGNKNPIGRDIFLSGVAFTVIGVYDDKSFSLNQNIFVPITTAYDIFGKQALESIYVFALKGVDMDLMKRDIGYFLYKKSGVSSPDSVDFMIQSNKDVIKMTQEILGKMQLFLGAIGSIALLVGGIGIMNIMLVSVTERTREIGIRKAIGATKMNILMQFLVESAILSLLGLFIAIIFCFLVAKIIGTFVSAEDFSIVISANVIAIAGIVSILMGIMFGIMPAYKAAKLRPVDTLRYE